MLKEPHLLDQEAGNAGQGQGCSDRNRSFLGPRGSSKPVQGYTAERQVPLWHVLVEEGHEAEVEDLTGYTTEAHEDPVRVVEADHDARAVHVLHIA
jgi:hypothetical protein